MLRRPWVAVSALALSASFSLRCSSCATGGPAAVYDPPPKVDVAEEPAPRPQLSVSLTVGTGDTEAPALGVGWPWLVEGLVLHPAAFGGAPTPAFSLPGPGALSLKLTDASGAPVVNVAFQLLTPPVTTPFLLDATAELALSWRLPASEAAKLAPGNYTLALWLEAPGANARSAPVTVTVTSAPDAGTYGARMAAAFDARARADYAGAQAELDALLADAPDDVQALTLRADAREQFGDLRGARDAYNAALGAALKTEPNAPEGGPRHLYHQRDALSARLDGGGY